METYYIKDDIMLICVPAASFPNGIAPAFARLRQIIGTTNNRKFFGISQGSENGKTIYKAAAEAWQKDDALHFGLEPFVLKKGEYTGARIINYPDHLDSIGKTFEKLLTNPRLDPKGCCVEMYLNEKDVQCMVRLVPKTGNKANDLQKKLSILQDK